MSAPGPASVLYALDSIWYSAGGQAGLLGVAFVGAKKFSKIYMTLLQGLIGLQE